MIFKRFRVQNYRNIIDSGWINVERLTAFVGQNESGKSNLFEALYRLHPFESSETYQIDEDWPADDWDGRDMNATVCRAQFEINDVESIEDLYRHARAGDTPSSTDEVEPVVTGPPSTTPTPGLPSSVEFECQRAYNGTTIVVFNNTTVRLDTAKGREWVLARLPQFVYVADYELSGTQIELDQLAQRVKEHSWAELSNEDQTILIILRLAKIELDDFLEKGGTANGRTHRFFDRRQASTYLTQQFARLWRQKQVRFEIDIDATTLNIFVEDAGLGMPVRLSRRSTGFRWHVSFAWKFTHASHGEYRNCILLLEEPGIHLHYDGHQDLLDVFEELSRHNTILYTTHISTLLDPAHPERVRIVEVHDHHAVVVHGIVSKQREPMMLIESRLGLIGNMVGLLGGRQTLIVEGGDNAIILQKLSAVLNKTGSKGLSDRIHLFAAEKATHTPMYAAFMVGHGWDSGVLLDSDDSGRFAATQIKELYLQDVEKEGKFRIFMMDESSAMNRGDTAIEDLFPPQFYVDCVNAAYGYTITENDLPAGDSTLITNRVESVLTERYGLPGLDKKRVASEIVKRFDQWNAVRDLPGDTARHAEKLFRHINAAFAGD